MERNKWETAIRCLEVALHPNTDDDEVIAGVNGFRRTAEGTPLRDICLTLAGGDSLPSRQEKVDRLNRENRDLRRRLDVEESNRFSAVRRLREAERRIEDLTEELRAAQRRTHEVTREFADFRTAYKQDRDDIKYEKGEPARRPTTEPRVRAAAPPFQKILAAARQRAEPAEPSISLHATSDRGGDVGSLRFTASPRAPWTA